MANITTRICTQARVIPRELVQLPGKSAQYERVRRNVQRLITGGRLRAYWTGEIRVTTSLDSSWNKAQYVRGTKWVFTRG